MRARLISGAVLVAVVVVTFLVGPPWLTLAIALLAALAAYETATLTARAGLSSSTWFPVIAAPLLVLGFAAALGPQPFELGWAVVAPAIALVIVLAAVVGFNRADAANGFRTWLGTTFATLYPALLAFAAAFVGLAPAAQTGSLFGVHLDEGRIWLVILVVTVWTLDSGAYLAGKTFPRGRFMNHISPHKTWTGAIGGTLAAIVVCTVLMYGAGLSPIGGALLGFVIAAAAQAGDLAESMLKRAAGAKDSGTLIPGHGGFLDRVDSFLFAAPAMFLSLVGVALLHTFARL